MVFEIVKKNFKETKVLSCMYHTCINQDLKDMFMSLTSVLVGCTFTFMPVLGAHLASRSQAFLPRF